jgi:hypothetical protein
MRRPKCFGQNASSPAGDILDQACQTESAVSDGKTHG